MVPGPGNLLHETGFLKSQIHPHPFPKIPQMNNNPNNLWQDSIYD
jgi:hypothetical protein